MDWEDLHNFLAIARHGSLSAAARTLGVTQSTMGRRLAALEARSRVTLLQKTPRGYVLTQAGEAALAAAERMEDAAHTAERAITGQDTRLSGEIRLTSIESLAAEILAPILATFAEAYPGIMAKLITSQQTLSLAAREADIAVRLARPRGNELVIRKLADMSFGFYASPNYAARHAPYQPHDPSHRLILMEEDSAAFPEMVALSMAFPEAAIALRANSRYVQLAACEAGMGIACLADYLAVPRHLVRLQGCESAREIWLAQHQDTRHVPRFKALTAALSTGIKSRSEILMRGGSHTP
ncbi:MAG TPA: LysR family transcriptional regulator [Acidocella sp.]|nr:LysR family transcriptional regulator [Acidocella sp.]